MNVICSSADDVVSVPLSLDPISNCIPGTTVYVAAYDESSLSFPWKPRINRQ